MAGPGRGKTIDQVLDEFLAKQEARWGCGCPGAARSRCMSSAGRGESRGGSRWRCSRHSDPVPCIRLQSRWEAGTRTT
jgi:hypothetical protein